MQSYTILNSSAIDYWALGVLIYKLNEGLTPFHYKSRYSIWKNIILVNYQLPTYFSGDLKGIVSALLQIDPSKRLGRTQGGINKIKDHSWFSSFDWNALYKKDLLPPITPNKMEFNRLSKDSLGDTEQKSGGVSVS